MDVWASATWFFAVQRKYLLSEVKSLCENTESEEQPTSAHWRPCVTIQLLTYCSDQRTFMCIFMTSPDHSLKLKRTERLLLPHCETFSSRYVIHTGARMLSDVFQSPPSPPSMLSLLGEWVHTGQKQSCNLKSHKYWLSITDLIPLYHADILHTATMFNPILLNRLEAIRSERITAAALCETETRLNHILCWSDTRLEWAEGSRRGQPFSEAETCKCTDSRDKSTNTEKTITERWEKKKELNGKGWELDGWPGWYVISSWGKCFTYGPDDWVSCEAASWYSSFISML